MQAIQPGRQLILPITGRFISFCIVLFLLFSQFHELSHIIAGRLVCGCFGEQLDFNVWSLCGNCFDENPAGFIPSLAGPAFSFICIWAGVYLLGSKRNSLLMIGFLLVMINKPFARLFTVIMGGGDELKVATKLLSSQSSQYSWILTLLIILLLTIPPLIICYRKLHHPKRLLIIISFCILPMVIQYFYQFRLLNSLLKKGIGSANPLMGIANLIHWHTLLLLLIALWMGVYGKFREPQMSISDSSWRI